MGFEVWSVGLVDEEIGSLQGVFVGVYGVFGYIQG